MPGANVLQATLATESPIAAHEYWVMCSKCGVNWPLEKKYIFGTNVSLVAMKM